MKQVILELPDETAAELEQVAPGHARQRSAFLRAAIREALDRAAEARMAAAYKVQPDDTEPAYIDPEAWQPPPPRQLQPARPPLKRAKAKKP